MIDSARFGSWRGLGAREHSRVPSERLFADLRKNANVEPSEHRNARYDKKTGTLPTHPFRKACPQSGHSYRRA